MENPSSNSMEPQTPFDPNSNMNPKTPSKTNLIPGFNSYHPSPSRSIYSDRFIPSRTSSNFALFGLPLSPKSSNTEDSNSGYTSLLRTALFGPDSGNVVNPVTPEKGVRGNGRNLKRPNCNIFRYKTETRQRLDSLLPYEFDDQMRGVSTSPVKVPRKVPKSPYKVLPSSQFKCQKLLNLVIEHSLSNKRIKERFLNLVVLN